MAKDDDIDFDEFMDDDFDFGDEPKIDPGSRTPVTRVTSAVTNHLSDLDNVRSISADFGHKVISRALPPTYSEALSKVSDTGYEITNLKDSILKEFDPLTRELKRTVRANRSVLDKILPAGIAGSILGWSQPQSSGSSTYGSSQPSGEEVDLSGIFDRYKPGQPGVIPPKPAGDVQLRVNKSRIGQDAIKYANVKIAQQQLATTTSASIAESLKKIVAYQDNILYQYHRKSLEVQFMQLYKLKDIHRTQAAFAKSTETALNAIQLNTALPEMVKMKQGEMVSYMAKQGIYGAIGSKLVSSFRNKSSFLGQIATGLKASIGEGVRTAADILSGISEAGEGVSEMGGMDDTLAAFGLSGAAELLGARAGLHIKNRLSDNRQTQIAQGSRILQTLMGRGTDIIKNMARYTDAPGMGILRDILERGGGFDTQSVSVSNKSIAEAGTEPVAFDYATRTSIVDVIPGYLSRQLQMLSQLVRGTKDIEAYDVTTNTFKSTNEIKTSIRNTISKSLPASNANNIVDEILKDLDPLDELDKSTRKKIRKTLYTSMTRNELFHPGLLYRGLDPKEVKKVKELIQESYGREALGVTPNKASYITKISKNEKLHKASTIFQGADLASDVSSYLENLVASGQKDLLKNIGILKYDDNGRAIVDQDFINELFTSESDKDYQSQTDVRAAVIRRIMEMQNEGKIPQRTPSQLPKLSIGPHLGDKNLKATFTSDIQKLGYQTDKHQDILPILDKFDISNAHLDAIESMLKDIKEHPISISSSEGLSDKVIGDLTDAIKSLSSQGMSQRITTTRVELPKLHIGENIKSSNINKLVQERIKTLQQRVDQKIGRTSDEMSYFEAVKKLYDENVKDLTAEDLKSMADTIANDLKDKYNESYTPEQILFKLEQYDGRLAPMVQSLLSVRNTKTFKEAKTVAGNYKAFAKDLSQPLTDKFTRLRESMKNKSMKEIAQSADYFIRTESGEKLLSILKLKLENGEYYNSKGQRIYSLDDMDGWVYDDQGNLRLDPYSDDFALYDAEGKKVKVLNIDQKNKEKARGYISKKISGMQKWLSVKLRRSSSDTKEENKDLYVPDDEGKPRLLFRWKDIKEGKLFNLDTGKPITSIREWLKKPSIVVDDHNNIVAEPEDAHRDIYDATGNLIAHGLRLGTRAGSGLIKSGARAYMGIIGTELKLLRWSLGLGGKATVSGFKFGKEFMLSPTYTGDIYILDGDNQLKLALRKSKTKQGKYIDIKSGKTIKYYTDITGPVGEVDDDEITTVITQEELERGLFTSSGKPVKEVKNLAVKTLSIVGKGASSYLKGVGSIYGLMGRGALTAVSGAYKFATRMRPMDVFVEGESEPRLFAHKMEKGKYIDMKSKKIIKTPLDIKGAVLEVFDTDEEPRVVLADDEIDKIVDIRGRKIKTRASKFLKGLFGRGVGALGGMGKVVSGILGMYASMLSGAGHLVKGAGVAGGNILSRLFGVGGIGISEDATKAVIESKDILAAILKHLTKVLPEKKKVAGDIEGDADNFRENSVEEIQARREEKKKEEEKASLLARILGKGRKDKKDKDKKKDDGLFGGLFSGLLGGGLKKLFTPVGALLSAAILLPLKSGAKLLTSAIWTGVKGLGGMLGGALLTAGKKVGNLIWDGVKTAGKTLSEAVVSGAKSAGKYLWEGAKATAKTTGKAVVKGANAVKGKIAAKVAEKTARTAESKALKVAEKEAVKKVEGSLAKKVLTKAAESGAVSALKKGAVGAAAVVGGIASAPAVAVAMTAYTIYEVLDFFVWAWNQYKLSKATKTLLEKDPKERQFSNIRFMEYGIDPMDKDAVARIIAVERVVSEDIEIDYDEDTAKYDISIDVDVDDMWEDLAQVFGAEEDDEEKKAFFLGWYQAKFLPIFVLHYSRFVRLMIDRDIVSDPDIVDFLGVDDILYRDKTHTLPLAYLNMTFPSKRYLSKLPNDYMGYKYGPVFNEELKITWDQVKDYIDILKEKYVKYKKSVSKTSEFVVEDLRRRVEDKKNKYTVGDMSSSITKSIDKQQRGGTMPAQQALSPTAKAIERQLHGNAPKTTLPTRKSMKVKNFMMPASYNNRSYTLGASITVNDLYHKLSGWFVNERKVISNLKNFTIGKYTALRIMEYGINPQDNKLVAQVIALEAKVLDNVDVDVDKFSWKTSSSVSYSLEDVWNDIAGVFGYDEDDNKAKQWFMDWYQARFLPVFTNHLEKYMLVLAVEIPNGTYEKADIFKIDQILDEKTQPQAALMYVTYTKFTKEILDQLTFSPLEYNISPRVSEKAEIPWNVSAEYRESLIEFLKGIISGDTLPQTPIDEDTKKILPSSISPISSVNNKMSSINSQYSAPSYSTGTTQTSSGYTSSTPSTVSTSSYGSTSTISPSSYSSTGGLGTAAHDVASQATDRSRQLSNIQEKTPLVAPSSADNTSLTKDGKPANTDIDIDEKKTEKDVENMMKNQRYVEQLKQHGIEVSSADDEVLTDTKNSKNKAKYLWPAHGRISSPFGLRLHPILHRWQFHPGIDIAVPIGTPVVAPADGVVIWAGPLKSYGLLVGIKHQSGFITKSAHLSRIKVRKFQKVKQGEVVAYSGMTGRATGPHIHFEFRSGTGVSRHDEAWDPMLFLNGGGPDTPDDPRFQGAKDPANVKMHINIAKQKGEFPPARYRHKNKKPRYVSKHIPKRNVGGPSEHDSDLPKYLANQHSYLNSSTAPMADKLPQAKALARQLNIPADPRMFGDPAEMSRGGIYLGPSYPMEGPMSNSSVMFAQLMQLIGTKIQNLDQLPTSSDIDRLLDAQGQQHTESMDVRQKQVELLSEINDKLGQLNKLSGGKQTPEKNITPMVPGEITEKPRAWSR